MTRQGYCWSNHARVMLLIGISFTNTSILLACRWTCHLIVAYLNAACPPASAAVDATEPDLIGVLLLTDGCAVGAASKLGLGVMTLAVAGVTCRHATVAITGCNILLHQGRGRSLAIQALTGSWGTLHAGCVPRGFFQCSAKVCTGLYLPQWRPAAVNICEAATKLVYVTLIRCTDIFEL